MTDWLKAEVLDSRPGFCRLSMIAREEMANGFGIIHGAITFALADSAIAFAANAGGTKIILVFALVSAIASETELNTGKPKCPWTSCRESHDFNSPFGSCESRRPHHC